MESRNTRIEISIEELDHVIGGTVNKNPRPDKLDNGIDQILNGKNYDAIAQRVADWLNGYIPRKREVKNDVDIYDFEI